MRVPAPGPSARNRDAAAARSARLADFSPDITALRDAGKIGAIGLSGVT
jgi:hypothetical protein